MASNSVDKLFGTISMMQTLTENFPMSIFELLGCKKYTSVIEFVLDVMLMLGKDQDYIVEKILGGMFKGEQSQENIANLKAVIAQARYGMTEAGMYDMLGQVNYNPLEKYETYVKYALNGILGGLLSCSAYPVIPDWKMDEAEGKNVSGSISVPLSMFDIFEKLNINPTTSTGMSFYNIESDAYTYVEVNPENLTTKQKASYEEIVSIQIKNPVTKDSPKEIYVIDKNKYYKKARKCEYTVNDLFKSNDLDVFIWYAMNRGLSYPQKERNKMMWDNRHYVKKKEKKNVRTNGTEWNQWLSSKKSEYGNFDTQTFKVKPIMQLERDDFNNDTRRLRVYMASQSYYNGSYASNENYAHDRALERYKKFKKDHENDKKYRNNKQELEDDARDYAADRATFAYMTEGILNPNKSMFAFNKDYLDSIELFSWKQILASMIKTLYGGELNGVLNASFSIQSQTILAKVRKIVERAIEQDDLNVSDCYNMFSNEDYDYMLQQSELAKYNAAAAGYAGFSEKSMTPEDVIEAINDISNSSTCGTTTTLKRVAYNVNMTEGFGDGGELITLGGKEFLMKLLMAIIMPFVEAILSPKIILLVLINMEVGGLVNLEDMTFTNVDTLEEFIIRKVMSVLSYLVVIIKDMIVEYFVEIIKEFIMPLFEMFVAIILSERIQIWIETLLAAMSCIPIFDFNFNKYKLSIDDVRYADIINTGQTETPLSTITC